MAGLVPAIDVFVLPDLAPHRQGGRQAPTGRMAASSLRHSNHDACEKSSGPTAWPLRALLAGARRGALAAVLIGFPVAAELAAFPRASRKNDTRSSMARACCSSVLAVAAFSSTSAALRCVTSSIWVSAL